MKWVAGTIGGIFLGFLFLVIFILFRNGAFKPVHIQVEEKGPYVLVYQDHLGAYHEVSPIIETVEKEMADQGLLCRQTFGMYLDNPKEMEPRRLRSQVGCIFPDKLFSRVEETFERQNLSKKNLKYEFLNSHKYISGSFSGSPALVGFKVYPKIFKWSEENRISLDPVSFEIYSIQSSTSATTEVLFQILDETL